MHCDRGARRHSQLLLYDIPLLQDRTHLVPAHRGEVGDGRLNPRLGLLAVEEGLELWNGVESETMARHNQSVAT